MLTTRTKQPAHIVLQNEHARLGLSPQAGASLRSLVIKARRVSLELLAGGEGPHDPAVVPPGTGSFLMVPWPNRIRNGRVSCDGQSYSLPITSGIHATHGTVRRKPFDLGRSDRISAVLKCELGPEWPFGGHVVYEVGLEGPCLTQRLTVHAADRKFPVGVGWHPWFRRNLGQGDILVQAPVEAVWVLDADLTPTGETLPPSGPTALNGKTSPAPGSLDNCLRVTPGQPIVLTWPEAAVRIESSPEVGHIQVYNPGAAICVEPQTCCIDAFRLAAAGFGGTGTAYAEPGKPFTASTTWTWS